MQVLGQRHERQPFAQVQARLPAEQRRLPGRNCRSQPPVANHRRQQLHFLVEKRKQDQWMPVADHAKDPRRRPCTTQDQQRPGEPEVHRDQPGAAWNGIPENRDQRARDRQIRRRQRRRPARAIYGRPLGRRRYSGVPGRESHSGAAVKSLPREVQRLVLRLEVNVPIPDLPAALELQRQDTLRRASRRIVVDRD